MNRDDLSPNTPLLRSVAQAAVDFVIPRMGIDLPLGIDPFYDSSGLTPLPCFKADLHKLLFHANGAADAKILWETARRADFRHYEILKLLELVKTR